MRTYAGGMSDVSLQQVRHFLRA